MGNVKTQLGEEKILKFREQGIVVTTEARRILSPGVSFIKRTRRFIPKYRPIEPKDAGDAATIAFLPRTRILNT